MPKKNTEKKMRLLRNVGDGALICDIPGVGIKEVAPGGTLELSDEIADFYLTTGNNGNWKEVKVEVKE